MGDIVLAQHGLSLRVFMNVVMRARPEFTNRPGSSTSILRRVFEHLCFRCADLDAYTRHRGPRDSNQRVVGPRPRFWWAVARAHFRKPHTLTQTLTQVANIQMMSMFLTSGLALASATRAHACYCFASVRVEAGGYELGRMVMQIVVGGLLKG